MEVSSKAEQQGTWIIEPQIFSMTHIKPYRDRWCMYSWSIQSRLRSSHGFVSHRQYSVASSRIPSGALDECCQPSAKLVRQRCHTFPELLRQGPKNRLQLFPPVPQRPKLNFDT